MNLHSFMLLPLILCANNRQESNGQLGNNVESTIKNTLRDVAFADNFATTDTSVEQWHVPNSNISDNLEEAKEEKRGKKKTEKGTKLEKKGLKGSISGFLKSKKSKSTGLLPSPTLPDGKQSQIDNIYHPIIASRAPNKPPPDPETYNSHRCHSINNFDCQPNTISRNDIISSRNSKYECSLNNKF